MAIWNYNENKPVYGASFESFKKFVCTAFTGYGLDPMRPGGRWLGMLGGSQTADHKQRWSAPPGP